MFMSSTPVGGLFFATVARVRLKGADCASLRGAMELVRRALLEAANMLVDELDNIVTRRSALQR